MARIITIPARGRWFYRGQCVRGIKLDGRHDIMPDDQGDEEVRTCARRQSDGPAELVVTVGPRGEPFPTVILD